MIFSSKAFIFGFLPIALLGFQLANRFSPRVGGVWLALVSLAFYAAWRVAFLPLLLISIAFNYGIGQAIVLTGGRPRLQSAVFFLGVAADLVALGYYKYSVALFASFGLPDVVGVAFSDIVLPLGISFFTFTQIGYLVDVKQGTAKTRDPLSYVLFVTFFPHLVAGPILHNREMMPQFSDPATYRFNAENYAVGFTIFCIGLFKKVVFADPLALHAAPAFADTGHIGFIVAWHGALAYSLQLYFDFSGYSDMAIGIARMFNVRFPLNFASPYKAASIIDFWQRWHMTLTRFITMYIFSPIALRITRYRAARGLNGGRAAATPGGFLALIVTPTLVTMGLAGIWHGAGFQYLIFGLLHGAYIVINHAGRIFFPAPKTRPPRPWYVAAPVHAGKVLTVYLAVLVSFCFFRAASTTAACSLLGSMIGLQGLGETVPVRAGLHIALLFAVIWSLPNTQQLMCRYAPALGRAPANPYRRLVWRPSSAWAAGCALLAGASLLAMGGPTEFLYFQF